MEWQWYSHSPSLHSPLSAAAEGFSFFSSFFFHPPHAVTLPALHHGHWGGAGWPHLSSMSRALFPHSAVQKAHLLFLWTPASLAHMTPDSRGSGWAACAAAAAGNPLALLPHASLPLAASLPFPFPFPRKPRSGSDEKTLTRRRHPLHPVTSSTVTVGEYNTPVRAGPLAPSYLIHGQAPSLPPS